MRNSLCIAGFGDVRLDRHVFRLILAFFQNNEVVLLLPVILDCDCLGIFFVIPPVSSNCSQGIEMGFLKSSKTYLLQCGFVLMFSALLPILS